MSKHIDQWRQIAASDDYNSDDRRIIRETLYWLDDHADPVPTNAEKLEQLHDQYRMFPAQHLPGNGSLADYLDHKGVKAPDHD